MKILNLKKSAGIGLIEVLITMVVVAVGLLAVSSLQSTLIGESRENKSRTEAKTLAESKIEEFRDAIVKDGAGAFLPAAGNGNDTVAGVTESYTRSWSISDQTGPERKEIEVNICWSDGCPLATGNTNNQLYVQSEVIFDNVGNSAKNLKDAQSAAGTTGSPSTNAESSDEIAKTKNVADGTPDTLVDLTADEDGLFWIRQDSGTKATGAYACAGLGLTLFENGLWTRRIDFDGLSGNEAIELFEIQTIGGTEYCIPRIRYNGGIIIPIRGTVHSSVNVGHGQAVIYLDVDLFTFNASESGAYCVFNPPAGARSAPYACYVGGNCTGFSGTTNDADVTKCPTGSLAATKVGPGGWRGKVGLLGVASSSSDFNNVCFAEEVAGEPAAGSLATARNYYSLRNSINEGINKPYSCHDFLIIAGQSTERQIHDECVTRANEIAGLNLAIKNIERNIPSGDNIFDPTIDTTYCAGEVGTRYVITGTIENADSIPTVTVYDSIEAIPCTVTTSSYSCTITTSATAVTMTGVYNTETITCPISPISSSGCTLSFTPSSDPVYTINGHILGSSTAANAVTISISDGGSCSNNYDGTYSCSISTGVSSVTLTAAISLAGEVTPTTQDITLAGFTTTTNTIDVGTDFSATLSTTYTIRGDVTLPSTVSSFQMSTDIDMGSCIDVLSGSDITGYECTVPRGGNHLHFSIGVVCSSSPSKKYEITDGVTTSLGTGVLIIDLGNVIGNVIKNIEVTRSSTRC